MQDMHVNLQIQEKVQNILDSIVPKHRLPSLADRQQ